MYLKKPLRTIYEKRRAAIELTDREAERRILSGMLHSENACVDAMSGLIISDFSMPIHQTYFDLISSLYGRSIKPTMVEVIKEGSKLGIIQGVKDVETLQDIASTYIDDSNAKYWIETVKTKSSLRNADKLIRKYDDLLQHGNDGQAETLLADMGADFSGLVLDKGADDFWEAKDIASEGLDLLEKKMNRYREMKASGGTIPLDGVPTGLATLDYLTLGYKPGDLIILGAQTGHGKTVFAMMTADSVAVKHHESMCYLNTEMSKEQIEQRWEAILSGIEHDKIRNGSVTNEEFSRIANAWAPFASSPLIYNNIRSLSPIRLTSVARKAKLKKNISMLVLDYVGRMDKTDPTGKQQEWQILEQVAKQGKTLAQELGIAVMVLAQLNPDGTLQGAKRMKNECDLMLRLRPLNNEEKERQAEKPTHEDLNYYLDIDKNRDGQSGIQIPLCFDMARQQIRQATKIK